MTEFVLPSPHRVLELAMDDGAIVRVRRHGNPNGLRLVVSHGNGFAADAYFPFWGPLLERYEVVLYDIRNYGQNPFHGAAGHSYARFVADLDTIAEAIASEFGAKTTVGVFHSLAARANMKRAANAEALWDAMVLFDPPMIPPADHPLREQAEVEAQLFSKLARTRRHRFRDPPELARLFRESALFRRWPPGACELTARSVLHRDEAAGDWVLTCPGELEALIYITNSELGLWLPAAVYERPLILIGGDPDAADAMVPGRTCQALAREHGYVHRAIPDSGHFLQIERPEACAQAMFAFLADIGIDT